MADIELSPEQSAIARHSAGSNARVLAGPGTGKSFIATVWLGELTKSNASFAAKMLTFTRAATAEFAEKLETAGLADVVDAPATVHSHALSVLMRMDGHGLPQPLRIPDSWETKQLIYPHLSRLLRDLGYDDATPGLIGKLEREMGAGWETLDEALVLLVDVNPALRAAYVNAWRAHRAAFGYTLLAELPYRAGIALEDLGEDYPPQVQLLLVDEYQDLNAADIRFIKAHADLGVSIVAIGDDDQSIYSWRHADPAGIRRFCDEFQPAVDYTLTISRRCGRRILAAAAELISTAPDRAPKPPVRPAPGASDGVFVHLRFPSGQAEARGAAAIAAHQVAGGVDPSKILLLVRSLDDRWRTALEPHFSDQGLTIAGTDWVDQALVDGRLRAGIALARLHEDETDSLAWWALTEGLTRGVGPAFTDYVYDRRNGERWGTTLLRLWREGFPDLGTGTARRAATTIDAVLSRLAELSDFTLPADEPGGWGTWLLSELQTASWLDGLVDPRLSDDAARLVEMVLPHVDVESGLTGLLNQLEPLGRDLATAETGGVRLMSMARSKGLTAHTVVVLGVEAGLVPFTRGQDENEERRLLYVAMTRATELCVLTSAARRTGPLARSGGGRTQQQRARSPLLVDLSYGRPADGNRFVASLTR